VARASRTVRLKIGLCPVTRKRRFRDHKEAIAALHLAEVARRRATEAGFVTKRREVRDYLCPMCRGTHLTSVA